MRLESLALPKEEATANADVNFHSIRKKLINNEGFSGLSCGRSPASYRFLCGRSVERRFANFTFAPVLLRRVSLLGRRPDPVVEGGSSNFRSVGVTQTVPQRGAKAITRAGAPDPCAIFIGMAITNAPVAGSWSRLVRFSRPGTFAAPTIR